MSPFEFVFGLFGLLVGLSYTEMLGGLARVLKSGGRVRLGLFVPLVGVLVLINLTMFWYGAWQLRDIEAPTSSSLLLILFIGGTYYLAAALVFPNEGHDADLDEHFFKTRKLTLTAIAVCNIAGLASVANNAGWSMRPVWWIVNSLFLVLLLLPAWSRNRFLIAGSLATIIGLHGLAVAIGR